MTIPTILGPDNGIVDQMTDSGLGYHSCEIEFNKKVKFLEMGYVLGEGIRVDVDITGATDDVEIIPASVASRRLTALTAYSTGSGALTIHDGNGGVMFYHNFASQGELDFSNPMGISAEAGFAIQADWSGAGTVRITAQSRPPSNGAFFVINEPTGIADILTMMGGGFPFELDKMSVLGPPVTPTLVRVPASSSNTKISFVAGIESENDMIFAKAFNNADPNVLIP